MRFASNHPLKLLSGALLAVALALPAAAAERYESERQAFRLVELVEGLESPWSLAFLPDGGCWSLSGPVACA